MLYLTRTDATRNMKRFYLVQLAPTLFGEWMLIREWGRIGQPGTVWFTSFESQDEAELEERRTIKRRLSHGYSARD
ncbi:MAG: WGR domain-containing protein [Acetobacteraceae bacterium]|nr:WGR domain-containing protein [Acetobacteraceae bacterium]